MGRKNNLDMTCKANERYLSEIKGEDRINIFKILIILILPFATFFGQYISIIGINISKMYSLILAFGFIQNLLKVKYKNIEGYISFFFIMILYAFASLIWSKNSEIGFEIIFPLLTGYIVMAYIAAFNENELKLFSKGFCAFTTVILVIAIIEIFTGKYLFFNNLDFVNRKNLYNLYYPGVAFTNPNDLAQFLLVGFPLIAFPFIEKNKRYYFVSILLFFVTIFIIMNTSSRLSVISMFIIVAFYFIVFKIDKGNKLLRYLILLCFVVLLIGILSWFGIDYSKYNIVDNFLKVDASQGYFTGRSYIYTKVFKLGLENILFGAGLGESYDIASIPPHNMFLFIFADLGFFFSIGFVLILLCAFVYLYKYKDIEICGGNINSIILSILLIFPIFSSISSGNEQRKIVWIALGLVFATINNCKIIRSNSELAENEVPDDN